MDCMPTLCLTKNMFALEYNRILHHFYFVNSPSSRGFNLFFTSWNLVRYAPNNNNHQVGLAAIQALAIGLRVNPTGSVTLQCMSPPRASSREGSLKRGGSPAGLAEGIKQQKISPLDRYFFYLAFFHRYGHYPNMGI